MSELAFDANGEPICFPAEAEELRVRRFRNPGMRGACEVVHDRSGAPLYVPVDTSYVDFRALVESAPGRYRLDPVDASRRVLAGAPPAYVTLSEVGRNAGGVSVADNRDSVIRELAQANADMAKTIADRFANVMQAAAELVRAADGAGLPRREPASPPVPTDVDDDEEDDDGLDDEPKPDVAALLAQLVPTLQLWITSKAAEKVAPPPAAAHASAPTSIPASAAAAAPVSAVGESGVAAGADAPESAPSSAGPPSTATEAVRNAAGVPTRAQAAHLLAIYMQLTPTEQRIAQRAVARMSEEVRADWLAEISAMTPDAAVAMVRSMIPKARSTAGAA